MPAEFYNNTTPNGNYAVFSQIGWSINTNEPHVTVEEDNVPAGESQALEGNTGGLLYVAAGTAENAVCAMAHLADGEAAIMDWESVPGLDPTTKMPSLDTLKLTIKGGSEPRVYGFNNALCRSEKFFHSKGGG